MTLEKESKIFNDLYNKVDGHSISWKARNNLSAEKTEHLIYGEIYFESLEEIYNFQPALNYIKDAKVFCDLGSGTGRIIFATTLILKNIKKLIGVELLKEMVEASDEVKQNFLNLNSSYKKDISFIENDFFNVNYSDVDIIFMHYPMKNAEELYLKLEEKLEKELKSGALIISIIRSLKSDKFDSLGSFKIKTSYGDITSHFFVKK